GGRGGGEAVKAALFCNGARHVTATGTNADANQCNVCRAGIGQQGCGGGFYVFDLGERVFKLARLAAAFAKRAMIECERKKAALSQCRSVGAGRLLFDAGQRAGEHGACTGLTARGREQIGSERRAVNLELVPMWLCHGTLLPVDKPADVKASTRKPVATKDDVRG